MWLSGQPRRRKHKGGSVVVVIVVQIGWLRYEVAENGKCIYGLEKKTAVKVEIHG